MEKTRRLFISVIVAIAVVIVGCSDVNSSPKKSTVAFQAGQISLLKRDAQVTLADGSQRQVGRGQLVKVVQVSNDNYAVKTDTFVGKLPQASLFTIDEITENAKEWVRRARSRETGVPPEAVVFSIYSNSLPVEDAIRLLPENLAKPIQSKQQFYGELRKAIDAANHFEERPGSKRKTDAPDGVFREAVIASLFEPDEANQKMSQSKDQGVEKSTHHARVALVKLVSCDSAHETIRKLEAIQEQVSKAVSLDAHNTLALTVGAVAYAKAAEVRLYQAAFQKKNGKPELAETIKQAREFVNGGWALYEKAILQDKFNVVIAELGIVLKYRQWQLKHELDLKDVDSPAALDIYNEAMKWLQVRPFHRGLLNIGAKLETAAMRESEQSEQQKNSNMFRGNMAQVVELADKIDSVRRFPVLPGKITDGNEVIRFLSGSGDLCVIPRPIFLDGMYGKNGLFVYADEFSGPDEFTVPIVEKGLTVIDQHPWPIMFFTWQLKHLTADLRAIDSERYAVFHRYTNRPALWMLVVKEHLSQKKNNTGPGLDFSYCRRLSDEEKQERKKSYEQRWEEAKRVYKILAIQARENGTPPPPLPNPNNLPLEDTRGFGERLYENGSKFHRFTLARMGYHPPSKPKVTAEQLKGLSAAATDQILEVWEEIAQAFRESKAARIKQPSPQEIQRYQARISKLRTYIKTDPFFADDYRILIQTTVDPRVRFRQGVNFLRQERVRLSQLLRKKIAEYTLASSLFADSDRERIKSYLKELGEEFPELR